MAMTGEIDSAIALWLNSFVGRSLQFDSLVHHASVNHFVKSLPPAAAIWFLWWSPHPDQPRRRAALLAVITACFVAMAIVRLLARMLPYRARPIQEPGLTLRPVADMPLGFLGDLSSMPSDHAGMFLALAVGLFAVSRAAGGVAMLHAMVIAVLPRLYLGLHYASDIAVGGLVGAFTGWLLTRGPVVGRTAALLGGFRTRPALAYTALFVITTQMAVMFDPLRALLGWARGSLPVAGLRSPAPALREKVEAAHERVPGRIVDVLEGEADLQPRQPQQGDDARWQRLPAQP
jgi:undecaprenyl-diphosphatase